MDYWQFAGPRTTVAEFDAAVAAKRERAIQQRLMAILGIEDVPRGEPSAAPWRAIFARGMKNPDGFDFTAVGEC